MFRRRSRSRTPYRHRSMTPLNGTRAVTSQGLRSTLEDPGQYRHLNGVAIGEMQPRARARASAQGIHEPHDTFLHDTALPKASIWTRRDTRGRDLSRVVHESVRARDLRQNARVRAIRHSCVMSPGFCR